MHAALRAELGLIAAMLAMGGGGSNWGPMIGLMSYGGGAESPINLLMN